MFVVVPHLSHSVGATVLTRSSPWWAYPFFLQNFLVHDSTGATGPLGVTWSVAIEEQFYLVWAVLVRCCSYIQLRCITVAVICLSPLLRLYLTIHHVDLYSNVFCRLDGLMAGGLLALLVRSSTFTAARFLNVAWLSLFFALPLVFLSEALQCRWLTFSLSAAASSAFVYVSLFATQNWFRSVLRGPMARLHWHNQLRAIFAAQDTVRCGADDHFDRYPGLALLIGVVASYAVAILSWNFLEKPFRRLKRLFDPTLTTPQDGDFRFALIR